MLRVGAATGLALDLGCQNLESGVSGLFRCCFRALLFQTLVSFEPHKKAVQQSPFTV